MTVEFEGNWVQCRYKDNQFDSEDGSDFESGKSYWFIDVHGQIEKCCMRIYGGNKVRVAPKPRYLDMTEVIGWIPDDRKIHISRLMLDGDYNPEHFVNRNEWDKFVGGAI